MLNFRLYLIPACRLVYDRTSHHFRKSLQLFFPIFVYNILRKFHDSYETILQTLILKFLEIRWLKLDLF